MFILSTYPINVFGDNPFINGSLIIRLVLIFSIDTFIYELLVNGKTLQFHRLSTFEILVVLREEYCCKIIIVNFQWLDNIDDYFKSWNKVLQPILLNCALEACHIFRFHSGCSNYRLLHTLPWNCSSSLWEHIAKCELSCVNTSGIIWIWISNHL